MENKNNSTEDYVVKFGLKAYLFVTPFILLIIGFCILFWFIDFISFYFMVFVSFIGLILWLYDFLKMKITVSGNIIEVCSPFSKKRTLIFQKIHYIKKRFGRIYFIFENDVLTTYFYMNNIKKFIDDATNIITNRHK